MASKANTSLKWTEDKTINAKDTGLGKKDTAEHVAITIFHAFDMHCKEVQCLLPQLCKDGYTHVQLSPMQQSRTTTPRSEMTKSSRLVGSKNLSPKIPWWFQYQPTAFVVGNCYGTASDLRALTLEASKYTMSIIVDVCFNFMAEPDVVFDNGRGHKVDVLRTAENDLTNQVVVKHALDTCYPPFTSAHFKPQGRNNWFQGQLPGLRLDMTDVQKVHFAYLQELASCGVTGFRFDCGFWFEPRVAKIYANACVEACKIAWPGSDTEPKTLDQELIVYWELTERRNSQRVETFCHDIGPALEYMHADKVAHALTTGNLTELINFNTELGLLHPKNVTFAVNHDTYNSAQSRLSIKFDKPQDTVLATCFLLSLQHGRPLIFCAQADDPNIKEGVRFRKHCDMVSCTIYQYGHVLMVHRRGRGVFVLNNSSTKPARLPARLLGPKSVCFIFSAKRRHDWDGTTDDLFVNGAQTLLSEPHNVVPELTDIKEWPALK